MSTTPPFPKVHVAVALIKRGSNILFVYNPNWGSYNLPMTKLREWKGPREESGNLVEPGADAAARAAGEWLAETFHLNSKPLVAPIEIQQSDRDREWKEYHFQVFQIDAEEDTRLNAGVRVEWLFPDDVLDPNRQPISGTARSLVNSLRDKGLL